MCQFTPYRASKSLHLCIFPIPSIVSKLKNSALFLFSFEFKIKFIQFFFNIGVKRMYRKVAFVTNVQLDKFSQSELNKVNILR